MSGASYLAQWHETALVRVEEDYEGVPLLHIDQPALDGLPPGGLVNLRDETR